MSVWISVKDRLPADGKEVMCLNVENGSWFVGWYSSNGWTNGEYVGMHVDYWTPRPKLPKEEE